MDARVGANDDLALILGAATAAVGMAVWAVGLSALSTRHVELLAGLVVITAVSETFRILPGAGSIVRAPVVAMMASALLFGYAGIAVTAPVIAGAACLRSRHDGFHALFELTGVVVAAAVFLASLRAGAAFEGGDAGVWLKTTLLAGAAAGSVRAALSCGMASLDQGESPVGVWAREHLFVAPDYAASGVAALLFALVASDAGAWSLLLAAPIGAAWAAMTLRRRPPLSRRARTTQPQRQREPAVEPLAPRAGRQVSPGA